MVRLRPGSLTGLRCAARPWPTPPVLTGNGDVIEPDDKIVAIGSGGMYALSAARMLKKYSNKTKEKMSALQINEHLNKERNNNILQFRSHSILV